MKLTQEEIEYLSAWSHKEWEPDCYQRPAHRLQLSHAVPGAYLFFLARPAGRIQSTKRQRMKHEL
jgi:hypothetical protein